MKKYIFDTLVLISVISVTLVNLHKKSINDTLNDMNDVAMESVSESIMAKNLAFRMTETEFDRSTLIQDYALNPDILVTDEYFSVCYNELTAQQRSYLDSIEYHSCNIDSLYYKYDELVVEFNNKRTLIDFLLK